MGKVVARFVQVRPRLGRSNVHANGSGIRKGLITHSDPEPVKQPPEMPIGLEAPDNGVVTQRDDLSEQRVQFE